MRLPCAAAGAAITRGVLAAAVTLTFAAGAALAQAPEELFDLRSTLHTEPLHEAPVPDEPGRFWIELDGVVHQGEIAAGFCGARLSGVTEPTPAAQDRFGAMASWRSADGAAWRLELIRVITLDADAWRFGGHESDNVTLVHREDGDLDRVGRTDFDLEAGLYWLVATANRRLPGDETIRRNDGPGPFPSELWPIVRVSEDGLRATADGVLRPPVSVPAEGPELPFRIAVHCPAP